MSHRPYILVSNDDGVLAPGNIALRNALSAIADVVTVAPEREMSAGSHSITLDRPLRHRQLETDVHAVDGTPADCIYIALYHPTLLSRRPDLVVSGINHGPNMGSDIYYSGTVAAAREGALRGIPAIAFSLASAGDMEPAALVARDIVQRLATSEQPSGQAVLLNVNIPGGVVRGVRPTRLGKQHYADEVTVRHDPRGREYFWIGGSGREDELVEGSDTEAVHDGYASVTPLLLRGTCADHLGMAAFVAGPEAANEGNDL